MQSFRFHLEYDGIPLASRFVDRKKTVFYELTFIVTHSIKNILGQHELYPI